MSASYPPNKNLRGRSFKDGRFKGTDFKDTDIRGCDFTNADLTNAKLEGAKINGANFSGANLTNAKLDKAVCGLKISWTILVAIFSLLISSASGFTASIIISCNVYFFRLRYINRIIILFISTTFVTSLHSYLLIHNNKYFDVNVLIHVATVMIIVVGAFIPVIVSMDKPKNESQSSHLPIIPISIIIVLVNALLGQIQEIPIPFFQPLIGKNLIIFQRFTGAVLGAVLGARIAHLAIINKDIKFVWIWNLFLYLASVEGTRFDSCNLTDASFEKANLRGSYFFNSTIIRTNWFKVKQIDCSRIQESYLKNSKIRRLVINKQLTRDTNYEGLILKELNLDKAELSGIFLSKADLSNSTLKDATLEGSNLSQTQLDNVDLTGANITGTTIKPKSVPSTAKLKGLICRYFYPISNQEQSHPNFGELSSGEATKLLQKPLKAMLFFEQDGIDWQAFFHAFKSCLKELNISTDKSENLIQGFERKLDDNFVIILNVPDSVDRIVFEQKLKQEYKKALEKLKKEHKKMFPFDNIDFQENTNMLKITEQLAKPGNVIIHNIFSTGNNTMTNNPGGFSVGGSVGGDVNNLQGDNNRAVQGDNNQVTQQNQAGTETQIPFTKEEVIKLLAELEALVKGAELPAETKEEVVEDLSSAKKATDREEPNKNRALDRLGSVADTLEKTSKTVDAGQKLWSKAKPIIVKIATWLGAAAGSHLLG